MKLITMFVAMFLLFFLLSGDTFAGNCDHSWQTDSRGRLCSGRAADVRPGGKLGGNGDYTNSAGNCNHSWQTDSGGRLCGDRAEDVRLGGKLGGNGAVNLVGTVINTDSKGRHRLMDRNNDLFDKNEYPLTQTRPVHTYAGRKTSDIVKYPGAPL